ncbi:MAG: serine/threonine protein kinase [Labilithrix sp.]|nr:serine/threonine protein kinase [Labilithrix sp.]
MASSPASSRTPARLLGGKLQLVHRIGRGGMGDVWVARNLATEADVAVKTLARAERTEEHDARFRREAKLAATISHRNVVRVFDLVDEADGTLGLVMELLRGDTLEDVLAERGTLTMVQAVAVGVSVLTALHHVHEKGIVHRDVKPGNVFLAVEPDGHVVPKILDFGIATLPAATSSLTADGSVLGTPHYMAPEQIRGGAPLDGRSDMFSMATVLYEALTGRRVFERAAPAASLAAVLEEEIDPDPAIAPRLWPVLARALAKRPYERYASCADFADALRGGAGDLDDAALRAALQELRPDEETLSRSEARRIAALASIPAAGVAADEPVAGPAARPGREPMPRGRVALLAAMVVALVAGVFVLLVVAGGRPAPSFAAEALVDAAAAAGEGGLGTRTAPSEAPLLAGSTFPEGGSSAVSDAGSSRPGRPAPRSSARPVATSPGF